MIKYNKKFEDERGKLVPIEFSELDFIPKRIFYVTDVPKNEWRGGHAHYETQQILICVSGRVLVKLEQKNNIEEFILEKDQFCFVDKMVWDSQKFLEENSLLLVLCSTSYDKDDYILDKEKFYNLF